jgi:hypothetical protein
MKVIQAAELPMIERANTAREGRFVEKTYLQGTPGSLDNFKFYMTQTFKDFYSPRHKHNFEQVRVQLSGTTNYDRDGVLKPGVIGYFPEGTPYGPTTVPTEDSVIVILQAGGPSLSGYASAIERENAIAELKKFGTFKNGAYLPNAPGGKNQDAFEATWEHINKRKLEYPMLRYQHPVFMNTQNFPWRAMSGAPGVSERQLGSFEAGFTIRTVMIQPGSVVTVKGRTIAYVMEGTGSAGGTAFRKEDVVYADAGETAEIRAASAVELCTIEMPVWKSQEQSTSAAA